MIFRKTSIMFNYVMTISLVLLLFSGSADAVPAEEWNKTFGGTGIDIAFSVQQTSDDSYILAGTTNTQSGNPNAWLIKTDANGNQQWEKTFGLTTSEAPPFVQKTIDGGFVFGMSVYDGTNTFDIQIIKFDVNGNQLWSEKFGKTDNDLAYGQDFAYAIQQTSDGGYIIAGSTTSFAGGGYNARLIKIDVNGNLEWNKIWSSETHYDKAYSVQQTLDGGYIFLAHHNLLIKTDSIGNEQWNRTFAYQNKLNSVRQTSDGGYIIAGKDNEPKVLLMKIDTNGNQQWSRILKGSYDDEAYTVQQTVDGGFVLAGRISLAPGGSGWLIKTDVIGNEQWNKTFSYGSTYLFSVQQTLDAGYILAGTPHALLIKISKDDSPMPAPTITYISKPTVTQTQTQTLTPTIPPINTSTVTPTIILTSSPTVSPVISPTPIITQTPVSTSNPQSEQKIEDLKERLDKTEKKQNQKESKAQWLESMINSILNWLKSIF